MRTNLPNVVVVALALGGLLAWGAWARPGRPDQPAVRSAGGTLPARENAARVTPVARRVDGVAEEQLRAMRRELESLREALLIMRQRQDSWEADASVDTPAPDSDAIALAYDEEAQGEQASEELRQYEDLLAADRRDVRWTATAAEKIEARLGSQGFEGTSLLTTECGATLCRIEFAFDDEQVRDERTGQIPSVLPTEGGGSWFVDPHDPLRVVFFAARQAS